MDTHLMGTAFAALADSTRLKILLYLSHQKVQTTEDELCSHIAAPSSKFFTITHHLHELEAVGLISIGRKEGQVVCSLRPHLLLDLAGELKAIAKGQS